MNWFDLRHQTGCDASKIPNLQNQNGFGLPPARHGALSVLESVCVLQHGFEGPAVLPDIDLQKMAMLLAGHASICYHSTENRLCTLEILWHTMKANLEKFMMCFTFSFEYFIAGSRNKIKSSNHYFTKRLQLDMLTWITPLHLHVSPWHQQTET